jgi:hypothetical protein
MRPSPRTPIRTLIPALGLLLAACGSGSSGGTGGSASTGTTGSGGSTSTAGSTSATSTGSAMAKVPQNHRAMASPCTAARTPANAGNAQGSCQMDADCTKGMNGRCVAFLGQASHCSYDDCAVDKDCGSASVCDCRNLANFDANTCFHGTCVVDADCAGSYCSPSAVGIGPDCSTGIALGSFGFFCHTPADECVDDTDCSSMADDKACIFEVDKMHWACHQLACTG